MDLLAFWQNDMTKWHASITPMSSGWYSAILTRLEKQNDWFSFSKMVSVEIFLLFINYATLEPKGFRVKAAPELIYGVIENFKGSGSAALKKKIGHLRRSSSVLIQLCTAHVQDQPAAVCDFPLRHGGRNLAWCSAGQQEKRPR